MTFVEVQIDRVVGPTHHFGGLGVGNLASRLHKGQESNPAAAALQGLEKMRRVAEWGVPQLILPPMPRPDWDFLRSVGFTGSHADILRQAAADSPQLLSAAMSCSAMWTANAATVAPTVDSSIERPTLTVANLFASLHRSIEPMRTTRELQRMLAPVCEVRSPLVGGAAMRDEGAANHMRFCKSDGTGGFHVFVYGDGSPMPTTHWPRQTRASVEAIARAHRLPDDRVFLLKQHPKAIDAGAFHNDVVAMSHHDLLIHHESAFAPGSDVTLERLRDRYQAANDGRLQVVSVREEEVSLAEAVSTYLFNSQILSTPGPASRRILLCPIDVERSTAASAIVHRWCSDGLFDELSFVDLGQSMDGGGGPACLRLRLPLSADELSRLPKAGFWSEKLDAELRELIARSYHASVSADDLASLDFAEHALETTAQIARLLGHSG